MQDRRSSPCQVNATLIFDSRGGYGTSILYIKPPRYSLQQEPTWYIIECGKRGDTTETMKPLRLSLKSCVYFIHGRDVHRSNLTT